MYDICKKLFWKMKYVRFHERTTELLKKKSSQLAAAPDIASASKMFYIIFLLPYICSLVQVE